MIKGNGKSIKKRAVKIAKPKKKCFECTEEKSILLFYKSNNQDHKQGVFNICKDCSNPKNVNDTKEVERKLYGLSRPFINSIWIKSIEESKKKGWSEKAVFGCYLKNIQMKNSKYEFADESETEEIQDVSIVFNNIKNINIEEVNVIDINLVYEDEVSKNDCIRMLGYDPFAGYEIHDQKILYAELIPYLDEDTLEDMYKIQVIIQILNNNIQIRKIDLVMNSLSSNSESLLKNTASMKNLTSTKNQMVTNNDKLAKENQIAVKHRGDKKAGQSTLGGMMKNLRELNFEQAEENYYDMKKAYGMRITAEISNKAILSQLNFDEKDMQDMFKDQRDLIIELQNKVEDLEEIIRITKIANKNMVIE